MSGSRLISAFGLVVIFCEISVIVSAKFVPVLIIGGHETGSASSIDALQKISSTEFNEMLMNKVGGSRSPIVVFRKDNLCVEELSKQKLKLSSLSYLPMVDSPLSVLENLESYNITKDEKPESISDGQVIIVRFDKDFHSITKILKNLKSSHPDVVGIITGASCSYSRSERTRRAAVTARADGEVITQADRVLLRVSEGIYAKTGSGNYSLLGEPTSSSESIASNNFTMILTFAETANVVLRLNFNATNTKYWYFNNIEYEANDTVITLTSDTKIFFPFNFSYHCSRNAIFYSNTTYVNFTDLQVQIDPSNSTVYNTSVFSDGYDCIGFTTIPIWSGIFTTAILALIFIWAITMIMDIRTMDRFDDPKGKTITIAVSE